MNTEPGLTGAPGAHGADTAIVTPEAVGLELPTATVGSRGVAYLLDLLILLAGLFVIAFATAMLGGGGFVEGSGAIMVLLLLSFAWQFGYPVVFEVTTRGRTLGKMAMGLRVVTVEGAPVGVRHAVIRAVIGLLELLSTLGAGAVITSLISSRGQRLGDLAAGTMVVRERRIGGPPSAVRFVPPPRLVEYAATLDTSAVRAPDYATLRDTLRRAPALPPHVRYRVTTRLANLLAARVTPPPPAGVAPEEWLTAVAAAVQQRTWPAGGAPTGAGYVGPVGASAPGSLGASGGPAAAAGTPPPPSAPPAGAGWPSLASGQTQPPPPAAPPSGPGAPPHAPEAGGQPGSPRQGASDDGEDPGSSAGFAPPA